MNYVVSVLWDCKEELFQQFTVYLRCRMVRTWYARQLPLLLVAEGVPMTRRTKAKLRILVSQPMRIPLAATSPNVVASKGFIQQDVKPDDKPQRLRTSHSHRGWLRQICVTLLLKPYFFLLIHFHRSKAFCAGDCKKNDTFGWIYNDEYNWSTIFPP